jgi:hypothetical protein
MCCAVPGSRAACGKLVVLHSRQPLPPLHTDDDLHAECGERQHQAEHDPPHVQERVPRLGLRVAEDLRTQREHDRGEHDEGVGEDPGTSDRALRGRVRWEHDHAGGGRPLRC